jgi:hypothetical protein
MKKLLILAVLLLATFTIHAQTNLISELEDVGTQIEGGVTNLAVEPFGIYALNHPVDKVPVGGGLALFYNLNNYVAPGAAVLYLGHASVFNGTLTLRLPIQPLPAIAPTLYVTPNILTGIESATDGDGGIGGVTGGGLSVSYGHLWGGQFNTGAEFVDRTQAGGYSGWAIQPFVGWSKSF